MTVVAVDRDSVGLTLTIVSEFDAPVKRVWQVWADARQLERWWGPPNYPATIVDHDLTIGGRVTYYMTGPGGEKLHGWWRIISVDPPRSLEFEEGCGPPNEHLPATTAEVRLVGTTETTTMTIITRFASVADMEQLLGIGKGEGTRQAVGQIDAILAITTASRLRATRPPQPGESRLRRQHAQLDTPPQVGRRPPPTVRQT